MKIDLSKAFDLKSFTPEQATALIGKSNPDPSELFVLFFLHAEGYGIIPVDTKKSRTYLEKGAAANDPLCTAFLAYDIAVDNNATSDMRRAKELISKNIGGISVAQWIKDKAREEHPYATLALGLMHAGNFGAERDIDKALELYTHAAELGIPDGINSAGSVHAYWKKQQEPARKAFLQAAEAKVSSAQLEVGLLGLNNPDTIKTALAEIEKSALQNNLRAQFVLAQFYSGADSIKLNLFGGNTPKPFKNPDRSQANPELAYQWYARAAAQGLKEAQMGLADCYFEGKGVAKNPEEASKLYTALLKRPAAGRVIPPGTLLEAIPLIPAEKARASARNSKPAATSVTAKKSPSKEDLLLKRAESGKPADQFKLGFYYMTEEGRVEEGIKWMEKAGNAGDYKAQYVLGQIYAGHLSFKDREGNEVALKTGAEADLKEKGDPIQAYHWFSLAADQKMKEAEIEVMERLATGNGVEKSRAAALEIYVKLFNRGVSDHKPNPSLAPEVMHLTLSERARSENFMASILKVNKGDVEYEEEQDGDKHSAVWYFNEGSGEAHGIGIVIGDEMPAHTRVEMAEPTQPKDHPAQSANPKTGKTDPKQG